MSRQTASNRGSRTAGRTRRPRARSCAAAFAAVALVAATLALPGCRGGGREEPASTAPPVPGAYRDVRVVYSLRGSFFSLAFEDGEQRLLSNAEGDTSAALFATWLPRRSLVLYESAEETRRSLWAYSEATGRHERLVEDVDAVAGVLGGREVLYSAEATAGEALFAHDLDSGASRVLLEGAVAPLPSSAESTGAICVAIAGDGGGQDLYEVPASGGPRRLLSVREGDAIVDAVPLPGGVVYAVVRRGAGGYGEVRFREGVTGRTTLLAEEARLLDTAEDGGVLVQRNLRGGVSGVTRSLVTYVPAGAGAREGSRLDLGAYVGTLHAAALLEGGRALVSQRTEGVNRLELFDLATGESATFGEDRDLQVTRIVPLDASSVLAVRIRPGATGGGAEGEQPGVISLADELVWLGLSPQPREPVVVASTPAGPLRLLGVARGR